MGRDAIRGERERDVPRPGRAVGPGNGAQLVNTLRLGGVEVERATASLSSAGKQYGAGTFVIRGAQPFRAVPRESAHAPGLPGPACCTPAARPSGPTTSLAGRCRTRWASTSSTCTKRSRHRPSGLTGDSLPAVVPDGRPGPFVLDPRANDAFTAVNRLTKAGLTVLRAPAAIELPSGKQWPAGAFVVPVQTGARASLSEAVRGLTLTIAAVDAVPAGSVPVGAPRVAVYHGWGGNIDEGWTRWVLEQFEFPYSRLGDAEVRKGDLRSSFDVVLLPDATYRQMLDGFGPGTMPDEYTGGMTSRGVQNLRTFTERGGILIAMDQATELPLAAFGLPIRDVTAGQRPTDVFTPGTILRIELDPAHPVAYGMPSEAAAFVVGSPAFSLGAAPGRTSRVVARYPPKNLLMSGWLLGERVIANTAAVMDVALGRGRIVLLGVRTQHRGQAQGTFKLLFHAIFLPPG